MGVGDNSDAHDSSRSIAAHISRCTSSLSSADGPGPKSFNIPRKGGRGRSVVNGSIYSNTISTLGANRAVKRA